MTFTKFVMSLEFSPGEFTESGHILSILICNERSELIFSDALYPINEFLLDTIKPEVQQNVRRVNRHPSNAQWAGGNEVQFKRFLLETRLTRYFRSKAS